MRQSSSCACAYAIAPYPHVPSSWEGCPEGGVGDNSRPNAIATPKKSDRTLD